MVRCAILAVLAVLPSLVKGELLPVRTYTTADSLASDRIYRITADSRGFLWFCTPEGLSRFDGTRFVSYGVAEGLPHKAVYTLLETRNGDHWIGTAGGLSRIAASGTGARYTNYKVRENAAANDIGALLESRSGKLWVATGAGLFEGTDPGSLRSRELPSHGRIADLAEDNLGNLWVGTTTGIFVLDESGILRSFTPKDGLPGVWVEMLKRDSHGRMWAALRGGLVSFRQGPAGGWNVEKIYKETLAGTDVKAVMEASDGTLWVGTTSGISRLTWSGGRETIENLSRDQGLSDRSIRGLAEDQAGNIWAGTEGAGVMRIARLGFTTFHERDGLRSDRVWSVVQGRAGELLALTTPQDKARTRSVDIFDGARFRSLTALGFSDNPTWGWDQVLLQSRTGEWWAATRAGLCRYPASQAAGLDGLNPRACYSRELQIFRIFEDSKGGVWASSQSAKGDRLERWNPQTDSVVELPTVTGLISAFAEDRDGNIWIGLYRGGLYRYSNGEFQRFERRDGVPDGSILALLTTSSGLWIGSEGGGLGRIKNIGDARPRVELFNQARGMASDIVHCLVEDMQGRIYAGTGKGVDRLDPRSGHIRHFSAADGLAYGVFHGALRDKSGALWFATTQGLSRLVLTADSPAVKPRVFVTDLRIGGETYPVSQLGETRFGPLQLSPSRNQLQAEFAGIDYEPGTVIRYSYKLEGADSAWSTPRHQPNVNYAALEAGRYRFLVKAVTSEGVESAPAEIDFTVLPPIWRRAWFVSLAVALTMALVFAGHRYRLAQMLHVERMRTSIATDLHDDIGSGLSQIAILSEVARVRGNGWGPAEPLERVATLARELVDSMDEIVWSIRSEPRGMESLVRRMREFALDLLDSQGIKFELHAPNSGSERQVSLQMRRQLFLMFKECIHNAARHSRCTAVVAELEVSSSEVMVTVGDNGSGMNLVKDLADGTSGSGISGMRRRAKSLGGRMELISTPGCGCTVVIRLPARRGFLRKTAW